ncbi:hypothetical protein ACFL27_20645, partial [candidate division CSSED10-310 bacterium]
EINHLAGVKPDLSEDISKEQADLFESGSEAGPAKQDLSPGKEESAPGFLDEAAWIDLFNHY